MGRVSSSRPALPSRGRGCTRGAAAGPGTPLAPRPVPEATITVLYPDVDDATFDLDYYMAKHMPLVDEKFKPFGIRGWRVIRAVGTPFGGRAMYSVIANLEFDDADQFRAAVAAEGGPVFGDVPNFSNKDPVVVIGDLVGASAG